MSLLLLWLARNALNMYNFGVKMNKFNTKPKAIMKKLFGLISSLVLFCFFNAVNVTADEIVTELQLADGLNCPCKAETIAPPPPPAPPAAPANYYREAEVFGLSKHLLDGGNNVTSKGDSNAGPFATGVTVRDIDDATEQWKMGGGRMTIGRFLDDQNAVEFTAMGFSHESDSFVLTPNPRDLDAAFSDTPGGFFPTNFINDNFSRSAGQFVDYDSRLISTELNHRIHINDYFSWIHGIRYAYFGDDLHFTSEDSLPVHSNTGILDIDGSNHLVGLQVGADLDLPLFSKLSLESGVKVGGFLNVAAIETFLFDDDQPAQNYRFEDTDVRGSTITEGKAALTWQFSDNVSASLGYMAMLLSWVTTAGENFPQANTAEEFQQHSSDHVLVHGPLASINVLLPPETLKNYYGSVEMFALNEHLLDGGDIETSVGDNGAGPFATSEPLRYIDDATREFDFGGGRLTVGRILDERNSVEFTVMGFSHQTDSFIEDPTNTDISSGWFPGNTGFIPSALAQGSFDGSAQQTLDYETVVFSGEINFRRQLSQTFSAIAGIRYASLVDDLRFLSEDNLPVNNNTGHLSIESHNHLVGLQIGGDFDFEIFDNFSLDGGLKVGGFLNISKTFIDMYDDDNGPFFENDEDDIRVSAISEGKLGMTWQFTPKISASLGYMAMLMSWVSSAGNNFPEENTEGEFRQNSSDHVLVHGPLARINIALP
jgi:hypothetical protein